ncbi:MAG: V-type ATP synthase subunit F [Candidatus Woesearchaeota archaeon]|jgi:V/A-type H+-transporting ATPase subunit F|nr:V-type ATP synthase subunit F [Candidatus Woesearchaeota archaeon]
MTEMAVVGNSEFVMGFQLIGIKKVFEGESSVQLKACFQDAMRDTAVGIIVTNDKALEKLDASFRRNVENSITPVTVVLSTNAGAQDNLRDMIKKAIGIDLWNK